MIARIWKWVRCSLNMHAWKHCVTTTRPFSNDKTVYEVCEYCVIHRARKV